MDIDAVKKGPVGQHLAKVNELRRQRIAKIREQDKLALELQKQIEGQQHNSKMIRKNLDACIAVSRKSGYIDYLEMPRDDLTTNHQLIDKIKKCEQELERLNTAIAELGSKTEAVVNSAAKPTSIKDWLDKNGRPQGDGVARGYISTFKPSRLRIPHHGVSDDGKPLDLKSPKKGNFYISGPSQKKSAAVHMFKGRIYDRGCPTP